MPTKEQERHISIWRDMDWLFGDYDPKFKSWSIPQNMAFQQFSENNLQRMLLFFPTGKGKSKTSLGLINTRDYKDVVVIAPPKTHAAWKQDARILGLNIRIESHAKFRMENSKYRKDVPIIMDEFHLLGGHDKIGFRKLNRMAVSLQAPIIMLSATPNYNDAERVFCLTSIGDDQPNRNYMNWLWENCICEKNYFSAYPDVVGFKNYENALAFLIDQPWVAYIEDDAKWDSSDLVLPTPDLTWFEEYGLSERDHKIVASDMEKRHKRVNFRFIGDDGFIRPEIMTVLENEIVPYLMHPKWMIFCAHKTVAQALKRTLDRDGFPAWLIDGDTATNKVETIKQGFISAESGWLIGTTALATGVDGIDKVCQSMLILDDIVGDPSMRRQLIGRILPRGEDDGIRRWVVTATFQ